MEKSLQEQLTAWLEFLDLFFSFCVSVHRHIPADTVMVLDCTVPHVGFTFLLLPAVAFLDCCRRASSTSSLFPFVCPFSLIANAVTGNPATQGYTVRDKRIIVLSQLGKFALYITLA